VTVDLALTVQQNTVGAGLDQLANFENLLGSHYFATASNDNNIMPGAPRTLRGTIRFLF